MSAMEDKPTCGQPEWHHDLFYCGHGCPWWPGNDEEEAPVSALTEPKHQEEK